MKANKTHWVNTYIIVSCFFPPKKLFIIITTNTCIVFKHSHVNFHLILATALRGGRIMIDLILQMKHTFKDV